MHCAERNRALGALAILALSACALEAQTQRQVVVPAGFAVREAPGLEFWALSPFAARRQVLVDPRHLGGLANRVLVGLAVRRNGGDPSALEGGKVYVEMTLSHSPVLADAASGTFGANRGTDALRVFAGTVDVPDAPPLGGTGPAPWAAPHAVALPFATPFAHAGGTLCLETITLLAPPNQPPFPRVPWWPLDASVERFAGAVQSSGDSCIPGLPGQPAGADPATLLVGDTAGFWLRGGRAQGSGVLALGTSARNFGGLALPFDLAPLGAPGCVVRTDIVTALPFALAPEPHTTTRGIATAGLECPLHPALAGARLHAQWWLVDPACNALGLAGSNALQVDFALPPSASGAAYLESTDLAAPTGRVQRHRIPILQFHCL